MANNWLMGALAAQDQYNPEEGHFQTGIRATPWFSEFKQKYGEEPNLNDPDYDYRAAWRAGARPDVRDAGDQLLHWPSQFKGQNHPNRYVDGVDTRAGEDVGVYRGYPRLDPGIRRAPGDTQMRPAAQTFGQVVGDLVIPQDPLDYAAMFALGPAGKLASKGMRAGALAMGGVLGLSDEAKAGKLKAIKQSIKAYHSSPHDFEKFDASKIGTGEGAQMYGHGLYFAENPKVSGQGGEYWNQFERRFEGPEALAAQYLKTAGFDRALALERLQNRSKMLGKETDDLYTQLTGGPVPLINSNASDYAQAMRLLESGQPVGPRTYEVNIRADPAQMLDWDKALTQQSPLVQDYLTKGPLRGESMPTDTGRRSYERLSGGERDMASYVSNELQKAGIPGIKYLDQGSRAGVDFHTMQEGDKFFAANYDKTKQSPAFNSREDAQRWINAERARLQTSNYVIFDPSIVDIMKKYGIAGAAAPMGALAAQDEYR